MAGRGDGGRAGTLREAILDRARRIRVPERHDWVLTLAAIYAVEALVVVLVVHPFSPKAANTVQPFAGVPAFVHLGWDTGWYRRLSLDYNSYVWPPLFPTVIGLLRPLFAADNLYFAKPALLVNLASHAATVWGLDRYARALGRGGSGWVLAFLVLFFPGHNVFFAGYSESMYLAATVLAVLAHHRGRTAVAGLLAGAAALVRTMGSFLCLALVVEALVASWKDRRVDGRRLAAAGTGLGVVLAWNLYVWATRDTTLVAEARPWLEELVRNHVPPGTSPRWWMVTYLLVPDNLPSLYYWATLAAAVLCLRRGLRLEAAYLVIFSLSIFAYTYRPFPWSRYVSVLFPWAVPAADLLAARPRLRAAAVAAAVLVAAYYQTALFGNLIGEP